MPAIQCHIADCPFVTEDVGDAVAAVVLSHHLASSHPPTAPAPAKRPVVSKPTVSTNIFAEEWASFLSDWEVYKGSVAIPDGQTGIYLVDCCSDDLR